VAAAGQHYLALRPRALDCFGMGFLTGGNMAGCVFRVGFASARLRPVYPDEIVDDGTPARYVRVADVYSAIDSRSVRVPRVAHKSELKRE
jgi:hypothetical protein